MADIRLESAVANAFWLLVDDEVEVTEDELSSENSELLLWIAEISMEE